MLEFLSNARSNALRFEICFVIAEYAYVCRKITAPRVNQPTSMLWVENNGPLLRNEIFDDAKMITVSKYSRNRFFFQLTSNTSQNIPDKNRWLIFETRIPGLTWQDIHYVANL